MTQTVSLAPPYALVEELRQALDIPSEDTANDVDLQRALDAARTWIDYFTGRTFGLTPAGTARTAAAATETVVPLIDLHSTTPTVEVDTGGDRSFATTLDPAQYALSPLSGPPFDQLLAWPVPAGGLEPYVFTPGELVRVTGVWGRVDARGRLPAPVNQAALLLGARWFARREAPFSVLQSAALDAFQTVPAQDADVVSLLIPLSLPGSPGAAAAAERGLSPSGAATWVLV
jgi:hypothetical protein